MFLAVFEIEGRVDWNEKPRVASFALGEVLLRKSGEGVLGSGWPFDTSLSIELDERGSRGLIKLTRVSWSSSSRAYASSIAPG